MRIYHKFLKLWKEYRVQLVYFIFCFNSNIYNASIGNLILQKACFPEGPPGTNVICNNTQVFKEFNAMSSTRQVARELLSGMVAMLAGPWRDHTGQTLPLMVLGHLGEIIACGAALVASLFWGYSAWASVIMDSLFGLMGGRILVTVAAMSYVSEKCSEQQRAIRLAILVTAGLGGMSIALAAGGFLMSTLDYRWLFVSLAVIYLINIALSFHSVVDGPRRNPGVSVNPARIFRRLKSVFIPRKNFFVSWVMLFASFAVVGVMNSEGSITQSFFQKVLYINPESSGLLSSFRLFASLIASLIATPLLIKVFKLSEFTVAIICTIPTAISCFGMAFVSTLTGAYIFYGFDMMRITLTSILWAILSNCVPNSEVGVYASFLLLGESISPLLTNPLYVYIFNSTIDYFPGAFFLVSGAMILMTTFLLVISSRKFEKVEEAFDENPAKNLKGDCELSVSTVI